MTTDYNEVKFRAKRAAHTGRGNNMYRRRFPAIAELEPGMSWLDIGAGTSRAKAPDGVQVVKVDLRYNAEAKESTTPKHGQGVSAYFQELPFRDESFDLTTGLFSLNWVKGPKAAEEALRVTKVGGTLALGPVKKPKDVDVYRVDPDALAATEHYKVGAYLGRDALLVAATGAAIVGGLTAMEATNMGAKAGYALGAYVVCVSLGYPLWKDGGNLSVVRTEEMSDPQIRGDVAEAITAQLIQLR